MRLPDGYRVERDPDVWTLIAPGGSVVARWIAGNVPDEKIERTARDHESGRGLRELAVAAVVGIAAGVMLGWGAGLDSALW